MLQYHAAEGNEDIPLSGKIILLTRYPIKENIDAGRY